MSFLNLIRYKNLIIIALMQVFVKYGFFEALNIPLALSDFQFILLLIATVCIAAAGNVINDIYDVDIDRVNKPNKVIVGRKISEKTANYLFIIFNVLGVGAGFYLANSIEKPAFAGIFILISALLYLYASYLKGILLLGNLLVSILVGLSILVVAIFDLPTPLNIEEAELRLVVLKIVLHYALFALLINFIREIVKDLQDIDGDKNGGINTLPIAIGRKRATLVVFVLGALAVGTVVTYMYAYLYSNEAMVIYFLFLVVAPLLYFCIKAWSAETKKDYSFLSLLLKITMLLGMSSILLYKFMII